MKENESSFISKAIAKGLEGPQARAHPLQVLRTSHQRKAKELIRILCKEYAGTKLT